MMLSCGRDFTRRRHISMALVTLILSQFVLHVVGFSLIMVVAAAAASNANAENGADVSSNLAGRHHKKITQRQSSRKTTTTSSSSFSTWSPVFGILTQPIPMMKHGYGMIAASYVKWLEAGGARSIPIPYDASEELIQDMFTQIDGILFPGGSSDLAPAAVHIWNLLLNDAYTPAKHDWVPLWGTCLGYEFLLQLASNDTTILEQGYMAENISLPLDDVEAYQLYKPKKVYQSVTRNNITMNNHHQGITPEKFQATSSLTRYWKITSTNVDLAGKPFVSTIEPIAADGHSNSTFPVFGVQYHPEKNAFEYATYPHTNIPYESIDHSPEGIAMSLYMANFLVDLARHNREQYYHHPATSTKASKSTTKTASYPHDYTKPDTYPLVYSYPMKRGIKFEQIFVIPSASHWESQIGNDNKSKVKQ